MTIIEALYDNLADLEDDEDGQARITGSEGPQGPWKIASLKCNMIEMTSRVRSQVHAWA